MLKSLETQLTMRCLNPSILESAPLMRCLLYKLQEINGERKSGDEKNFVNTLRMIAQNFDLNFSGSPARQAASGPEVLRSGAATPVYENGYEQRSSLTSSFVSQSGRASSAASVASEHPSMGSRGRTIVIPKVDV